MQLLPLNFDISLFQAFNALRFIEKYQFGVRLRKITYEEFILRKNIKI
jgi:hypothetical protein